MKSFTQLIISQSTNFDTLFHLRDITTPLET